MDPVMLTVETLVGLDNGKFAASVDDAFQSVLRDVDQRPHEPKKRTVTIVLTFANPTGDINRGADTVQIGYGVKTSIPPQKSREIDMRVKRLKASHGPDGIFAEFTPEVPQADMFEEEERRLRAEEEKKATEGEEKKKD